MTLTGELRILDDKILQSCIKANQAQYELDREAAKISELWSKDLDKYAYLNGGDLGYKPGVVERAKFQYSPLGEALKKAFKNMIKTIMIWRMILGITSINTMHLVLIK